MKTLTIFKSLPLFIFAFTVSFLLSSCNQNNPVDPSNLSDDDYLKSVALNSSYSSDQEDDDNLLSAEVNDFDSEGAVFDDDNTQVPLDSVLRWGRRITNVTSSATITSLSDTLKQVDVIKSISGNLTIIGSTGGVLDSVVKPFRQEQKRIAQFVKVRNTPNPRLKWRLYKYSAVDGETKEPQIGKSNITMNKVEVYKNGNLALTLLGPDFTVNMFNARRFLNHGHVENTPNGQVTFKVYLTSNQSQSDLVFFHWARNHHGHHRVRFEMTSEIPNGSNWDRVYEKTFNVFPNHLPGVFNGFISATTRVTLFDNDVNLLSSTYMGFPYVMRPHP